MLLADRIGVFLSSGYSKARRMAFIPLSAPIPDPTPIEASPRLFISIKISEKLIWIGLTNLIKSVIAFIAWEIISVHVCATSSMSRSLFKVLKDTYSGTARTTSVYRSNCLSLSFTAGKIDCSVSMEGIMTNERVKATSSALS